MTITSPHRLPLWGSHHSQLAGHGDCRRWKDMFHRLRFHPTPCNITCVFLLQVQLWSNACSSQRVNISVVGNCQMCLILGSVGATWPNQQSPIWFMAASTRPQWGFLQCCLGLAFWDLNKLAFFLLKMFRVVVWCTLLLTMSQTD